MSFLENSSNLEQNISEDSLSQSRKYNIIAIVVILALLGYFYSLIFGTSSILVLLDINSKKDKVESEYNALQNQNQKLQKKYFELIQLTPDDDLF